MIVGTLFMSAGFAMVLIVYSAPMAFVGGTLIAVGFGLANPSLSALISKNAPQEHQGAAMGASQSTQSLCRIFGPISAGAAFGEFGRDAPYLVGAILLFLSSSIAIMALKHAKRSQSG